MSKSILRKLGSIRKRALAKGLAFDLTPEWYVEKLNKGVCEVTGLEFYHGTYNYRKGIHPFIPSVDRTDSNKGYTQDNCKLVIMAYNQAKADFSEDVLKEWAKCFIERYES